MVEAFRIERDDSSHTDKIVAYMLADQGDELLLPPINNVDEFKKKYLETHNISSWPTLGLLTFARVHSLQDSEHNTTHDREENPLA